MDSATQAAPISKGALWTGTILSRHTVLLLLASAIWKLGLNAERFGRIR